MSKAIVLFSGGMDSTFCLFHAMKNFDEVSAITFDYGQRHAIEVLAAKNIVDKLEGNITWETVSLLDDFEGHPLLAHKNCPLMDRSLPMEVFENYQEAEQKLKGKVEPAFIPMRNSIFLDIAVNQAICNDCHNIYIGISKEDGDTVPDCRKTFLDLYTDTTNYALGLAGFDRKDKSERLTIHSPLLDLGKVNGILEAFNYPGCYTAFAFSHTSYFGEYPPRARDHASVCREWAFEKAGVPDPLIVRAYLEDKSPLTVDLKWGTVIRHIKLEYIRGNNMWESLQYLENLVRDIQTGWGG